MSGVWYGVTLLLFARVEEVISREFLSLLLCLTFVRFITIFLHSNMSQSASEDGSPAPSTVPTRRSRADTFIVDGYVTPHQTLFDPIRKVDGDEHWEVSR